VKTRGAVVLLDGDSICLIKRKRAGQTYYLFPGGGVEAGETLEQTAVREAFEELGVQVELDRLVANLSFKRNRQYYYTARVVGGEVGTGRGEEMASTLDSPQGTFTPVWLTLREALQVG
jgi:8-oxo-dGTP diphosphatase